MKIHENIKKSALRRLGDDYQSKRPDMLLTNNTLSPTIHGYINRLSVLDK